MLLVKTTVSAEDPSEDGGAATAAESPESVEAAGGAAESDAVEQPERTSNNSAPMRSE